MAVDKSTYNRKIKVSQSTIDDIKKLGMTKALRLAKENSKATQGGLVAEYQEATRRLYGDRRFAAATGTAIKKAPGTKVYNPRNASKPAPANPKQADKAASTKASTKYSPTPMKTPAKKNNNAANIAKGVAGTAAAIGLLVAGRGKGAGVIAKLSPQVGRALNSPVGRVLSGTAEKAKTAATVTSGKAAAKAGKAVSQSQYDAMVAAAKARGISTVAKKATTTAAKKTAAKKVVKKAAAPAASKAKTAAKKLSAGKRWDANAPK